LPGPTNAVALAGQYPQLATRDEGVNNIAGIGSKDLSLGLMPHLENLIDPLLGGTDGSGLFESAAGRVIRKSLWSAAKLHASLEIGERPLLIAFGQISGSSVTIGYRALIVLVFRVEADGFGVIFNRAVQLALFLIGIAPGGISTSIFRIEADGFGIIFGRAVPVALFTIGIASGAIGESIFRIEGDGFGEIFDRAIPLIVFRISQASVLGDDPGLDRLLISCYGLSNE
jgi:hypothetical protein